jgi:hypothetical protein
MCYITCIDNAYSLTLEDLPLFQLSQQIFYRNSEVFSIIVWWSMCVTYVIGVLLLTEHWRTCTCLKIEKEYETVVGCLKITSTYYMVIMWELAANYTADQAEEMHLVSSLSVCIWTRIDHRLANHTQNPSMWDLRFSEWYLWRKTVIWDVMSCNLVVHWNLSKLLPDCMASHPRRFKTLPDHSRCWKCSLLLRIHGISMESSHSHFEVPLWA